MPNTGKKKTFSNIGETTVKDKHACCLNNTASELSTLYGIRNDEPIVDISCSFFRFLFLCYSYILSLFSCFFLLFLLLLCFTFSPFLLSVPYFFLFSFNSLILSEVTVSLVHNHAHFTYRVLTPDIAYYLVFIILTSPDNCQWSRYQRDLVNTTLYSLL